jgi:glycosyltransferase involved in cell wall biosynthesis
MYTSITAVIITKNEEKNIERCILSLAEVVDEVLVVDSGSTDKTLAISRELGASILESQWLGYAKTKNLGNTAAKNDFILSIDADEVISPALKKSILRQKKSGLEGIYSFNRLTNYCGKWIKHSGWYPDVKVRIFNKRDVHWTGDFVHEILLLPEELKIKHLPGDLLHYSYNSKADHIARTKKYADLSAEKMFHASQSFGSLKPFISGTAKFIKMYVLKRGFLDGSLGLQIAKISAQGVHSKYRTLAEIKARKN